MKNYDHTLHAISKFLPITFHDRCDVNFNHEKLDEELPEGSHEQVKEWISSKHITLDKINDIVSALLNIEKNINSISENYVPHSHIEETNLVGIIEEFEKGQETKFIYEDTKYQIKLIKKDTCCPLFNLDDKEIE